MLAVQFNSPLRTPLSRQHTLVPQLGRPALLQHGGSGCRCPGAQLSDDEKSENRQTFKEFDVDPSPARKRRACVP
eukprot:1620710-Pleurochrysis_carterae.AAC.2